VGQLVVTTNTLSKKSLFFYILYTMISVSLNIAPVTMCCYHSKFKLQVSVDPETKLFEETPVGTVADTGILAASK